jgi:PhnB protein
MKAIPYLFFDGACAEALAFYRDAVGAEIRTLVRFRDMPGASPDAGDRVMHAEFSLGESTVFASDGQGGEGQGSGYAICLLAADDVEAERLFAALGANGRVNVPLMSTPFASRFGMLSDRYGTPWMITTPQTAMG